MRLRMAWVVCLAAAVALFEGQPAEALQTPPPEFHPPDGASVPTNVVISCASGDAEDYYTTDGTEPTTNSLLYTTSLNLTNTTTLRARAFLTGFSPSEERTATYYERYAFATVQKLVANDETPTPSISINVTPFASVKCYAVEESIPRPLEPSDITGGGVWDENMRTIRWGPFRDADARSLNYQVSCWQDGIYEISSQISLNGFSTKTDDISTKATVTIRHTYAKVATPVFDPPSGATAPLTASITCATTNAVIYFTTDGTLSGTTSTQYVAPLILTDSTFLRARAFLAGMEPSDVTGAAYWTADAPPSPTRSITNSSGAAGVNVSVTLPDGLKCYALLERLPNNLEPTQISSNGIWQAETHSILWGPFRENLSTNLTYWVTGPDGVYTVEGVASFDGRSVAVTGDSQITIARQFQVVATPTFNPPSGAAIPVAVEITCATAEAAVYYTTNGALPTTNDTLYVTPLSLTAQTVLRARAFKSGWLPSDPVSASYFEVTTQPVLVRSVTNSPSASPEVSLVVIPTNAVKSYAVEERLPVVITPSDISYNGLWDEATATIRWGPFQDAMPRTLTYRVTGPEGMHTLEGEGSFDGRSFAITGDVQAVMMRDLGQQVETPLLSPSNSISLPVTVTMSCGTPGAEIRYTTDTTVPTTNALLYTGPLQLTTPTVLRARAFRAGMTRSDTVTGSYVEPEPSRGTVVRAATGNGSRSPICTLTATPTASVKSYAVEEHVPALLAPVAISHGGSWDTNTLTIQWGPFEDNSPRSLTYTLAGPDGEYVLDGAGSFDGWSTTTTGDVAAVIAGRLVQVAAPTFNPPSGAIVPVTVAINCATPGALIYYTTNGLVPTTNDTLYTGGLVLTTETVLHARAFVADMLPSDTASAVYVGPWNLGASVRTIVGSPSTLQSVSVEVTPSESVKTYAVEESVPLMLVPTAVSHNGSWQPTDRMIRWGPFRDHTPRTLTYVVSGPDGQYAFDGAASFDGVCRETTGDTSTTIQFPAPTNLTAIAGNGAVYLLWSRQPGVAGYNVYYWTAPTVGSPQVIDAGIPSTDYFPVTGLTNNTEYYFNVTAYDQARHESGHSENIKAVPTASGGILGFVWFDRAFYGPTSHAIISVADSDLNTDPITAQTATVKITSDSDAWGFTMTLAEAGVNTNLFTSEAGGTNLSFTSGDSDVTNKFIKVAEGDRVMVVYSDVQPALERTNTAIFDASAPQSILVPSESFRVEGGTNYASITFTYSLTATDAYSGVPMIVYGIDAPPSIVYTQAFAVASEGWHEVRYRAVDGADNWEPVRTTAVCVESDFDHDGLPDQWERQYANNLAALAPWGDWDGDGFSDLQEYLTGTNPTDGASAFRIISVAQQGDDIRVAWGTGGGRTNVLQATAGNVNGGYTTNFVDLSEMIVIPGSGDAITNYVDIGGATNASFRFYRVRLVP